MVGIASIDFWRARDPRFPRWLSWIGALTVAAFIGFLVTLRTEGLVGEDALAPPDVRQAFWIVPTLEWALILGILGVGLPDRLRLASRHPMSTAGRNRNGDQALA